MNKAPKNKQQNPPPHEGDIVNFIEGTEISPMPLYVNRRVTDEDLLPKKIDK